MKDLFEDIALNLYKFEEDYIKKYEDDDIMISLIENWRSDFSYKKLNMRGISLDEVEDEVLELIELEDIDKFTFEVFGFYDHYSPLRSEFEKILFEKQQKWFICDILKLLKKRIEVLQQ